MSMKKVSIIIPCYNAEKYIAETIHSVLAQKLLDAEIEIIIINDGSTDGSEAVLNQFGSNSSISVYHQENAGVSRARNKGIELASGDFIQFLDSDDLLEPNKLQNQIEALKKTGADVAYGDWIKYQEKESGMFYDGEKISRSMINDPEIELFTDFWCPPAALLFRSGIVRKIGGFRETLPIIQDARFFLDSALVGGTFVYTSGVMAKYRITNQQSLSRKNPLGFVNDCYVNAVEVFVIWKETGISQNRKNALLSVLFNCSRFFYEHDRKKFNQCYNLIRQIDAKAIPQSPRQIRYLSKIVGYRGAEFLALNYRKLRSH